MYIKWINLANIYIQFIKDNKARGITVYLQMPV